MQVTISPFFVKMEKNYFNKYKNLGLWILGPYTFEVNVDVLMNVPEQITFKAVLDCF